MDFFKSGLKSVLGAQPQGNQYSGEETVDKLIERVQSSTLLEDRRGAVRALKALSRKHRLHIGAHGMNALRDVLESDRADCEIVGDALDTFCNITSPNVFEEEEPPDLCPESLEHVGERFTEIFIKDPENVTLVLSFLEEYDFKVRWPALKLLNCLLENRLRDIQEIILVSPMGVTKLMDLLGDSREVIRNEALLLLVQLTKGNANIQKIVAFQNAFDRLFDVISEEGYADGGIVVEDCLILMLNLLKNNSSNQNFFKEGSFISKLAPMFIFSQNQELDDPQWSVQKVANLQRVLQVIRSLVSPGNPTQVTSGCQKDLFTKGILNSLTSLLMLSGVPAELITEAICAVGETIRGNSPNQQYFSKVMAPSDPPKEALVVLLRSMVNEKQCFPLRCAVLYCFQCFLYRNEVGQAQLVLTLLPTYSEVQQLTCGQLLCSGLLSHDPLSNWFSAVALSHVLIEAPMQKEQLLRVLLAPYPDSVPLTLLNLVTNLLQQSSKIQTKVGMLILIATWLSHCPLAVKSFIEIPSSIPYLTSQAASQERDENEELLQGLCAFLMGICLLFNDDSVQSLTKDGVRQLIGKRVGVEIFLQKLSEVCKHEQYSKAAKHPQPAKVNESSELLLDHEFCKLFKALEGMVIKAVTGGLGANGMPDGGIPLASSLDQDSALKDLIREQDKKISSLNDSLKVANQTVEKHQTRIRELEKNLSVVKDESVLLKAQLGARAVGGSTQAYEELDRLKQSLELKDSRITELEDELAFLRGSSSTEISCQGFSGMTPEVRSLVQKLNSDRDKLLEYLCELEQKVEMYKTKLRQYGEEIEDEDQTDLEADESQSPPTPSEPVATKMEPQGFNQQPSPPPPPPNTNIPYHYPVPTQFIMTQPNMMTQPNNMPKPNIIDFTSIPFSGGSEEPDCVVPTQSVYSTPPTQSSFVPVSSYSQAFPAQQQLPLQPVSQLQSHGSAQLPQSNSYPDSTIV